MPPYLETNAGPGDSSSPVATVIAGLAGTAVLIVFLGRLMVTTSQSAAHLLGLGVLFGAVAIITAIGLRFEEQRERKYRSSIQEQRQAAAATLTRVGAQLLRTADVISSSEPRGQLLQAAVGDAFESLSQLVRVSNMVDRELWQMISVEYEYAVDILHRILPIDGEREEALERRRSYARRLQQIAYRCLSLAESLQIHLGNHLPS